MNKLIYIAVPIVFAGCAIIFQPGRGTSPSIRPLVSSERHQQNAPCELSPLVIDPVPEFDLEAFEKIKSTEATKAIAFLIKYIKTLNAYSKDTKRAIDDYNEMLNECRGIP